MSETRTERVLSSETRLQRLYPDAEPVPLRLTVEPTLTGSVLTVRLTATKACAYRRVTRQKRERVIARHADATVMGLEKGIVGTSAVFFLTGVVVLLATSHEHKSPNDCGASALGCSNGAAPVLLGAGIVGGMYSIPVLAIDSVRQLDSSEPIEDRVFVSKSLEVQPCGTALWSNAEVELRSDGPSGKARTNDRGEAQFPWIEGWTGPVDVRVDGRPAPGFSL